MNDEDSQVSQLLTEEIYSKIESFASTEIEYGHDAKRRSSQFSKHHRCHQTDTHHWMLSRPKQILSKAAKKVLIASIKRETDLFSLLSLPMKSIGINL